MNAIHDRAKSIFLTAAEIDAPEERQAFVDAQCAGDDSLRSEVDELLRHQQSLGSFLELPAVAVEVDHTAMFEEPLAERAGTVIGPYMLLEQIGEGGMGVVFMAEQERPMRRKVALKIIKPGMDTREVIARFEAERQVLAMMDHPNIAKVYDAGATENGRPYFVMELVQGVPITDYCDECNLTSRERLELFITVCQAVQHAHQKGVIHRDIKPTNVLVAMQDGRPAPKIIDFGVAKAIDQRLTEHTLTTAFAQMVGTPMYMSPEQAALSPLGVDTRSDIYSLGVLLYELLAGTTPFDKDRLHAAPYDELRRIIREEEPPPPSNRISTLAADLATTVAGHRRTDAHGLRQTVHGELDWIVMKCLEKDRNRRYDSAGSLARDIERYLHDEPVQACPPSTVYRLKKFIRRNKIAAAFVMLLVGAVAALAVSNIQTRRSERRATTENAKALAVSNLLQDMLRSANPDEAKDAEYSVRQLLDDFSASFGDGLPGQPEVEAEIRATIGRAYWRLGVTEKAEPHLTRALDLRRGLFGPDHELVAESLVDTAWCRSEQGRFSEAEAAARDALRIYRDRGAVGSPVFKASVALQHALIMSQRLDEAQTVADEALTLSRTSGVQCPEIADILHNQAETFIEQGHLPEAERSARLSVEMHRRLHGPGHPETAWGLRALGETLQRQQKLPEAEQAFREALEIFRKRYRGDHFSVTTLFGSLKQVLKARGDQSALEALAKEEVDRAESANDDLRIAELLVTDGTKGKTDEARRLVLRAIDNCAKVKEEYPDDLDRRAKALDAYAVAIGPCAASPDLKNEFDKLNHQLAIELPGLLEAFPNSRDCEWWTALIYRGWAMELLPYSEHLALAEQNYRESIKILERLAQSDPNRPQLGLYLGDTYILLGEVQWRLNKLTDAEGSFRQAMKVFGDHAAEISADTVSQNVFAVVMDQLRFASFLAATERQDEAIKLVEKAVAALSRIHEPTLESDAQFLLANLRLQLGDDTGYRKACVALSRLSPDATDEQVRIRRIWVWCLAAQPGKDFDGLIEDAEDFAKNNALAARYMDLVILGALHFRAGQYEQAATYLNKSIDEYPADPPVGHGATFFPQLFLAMTKWQQGQHDEARKLLAVAQPAIDKFRNTPKAIWYGRGQFESLRREAEAMIGSDIANEAVENESRTNNEPKQ